MSFHRDYIIVAALDMETEGLQQFAPLVHCGIGKVNAAIHLYDAILTYKPGLVINYGTAGTVDGKFGLHRVETIIQRDMDVRPLGVPRGVTPFMEDSLPEARGIVLGSGDSFVIDKATQLEGLDIEIDLIDMEAYALQRVCRHHRVDFHCYKYVTDSTDENSSAHWRENVAKGVHRFARLLQDQYGKSSLL